MLWKKIIKVLVTLIVLSLIFLTWYTFRYSMDVIKPFEVNDPKFSERVLIATQGSKFKEEVVTGIIGRLQSKEIYIQVIDVTQLPEVEAAEWSAIIILHTWENWKPQKDAEQFITRQTSIDKIIAITTSGSGNYTIKNIDAISSASLKQQIPELVNEITQRVEKILQKQNSKAYENR
jgi:hypothetical protein